MSKDIHEVLNHWKYDADAISARWIHGVDGRPKVQLRVDLGILQMESEGRPDGEAPHGFPSLQDYYLSLEAELETKQEELTLDAGACGELQREALQYYYRYLAFYALHHLDGVIDDTRHNLQMFDLLSRCAEEEDLIWPFLQYFPYVRMMNARARAEKLAEGERYDEAISLLNDAIQAIELFFRSHGSDESLEESHELEVLDELVGELRSKRPKTVHEDLMEQLQGAIALEQYEKAAQLRDKLKALTEPCSEARP